MTVCTSTGARAACVLASIRSDASELGIDAADSDSGANGDSHR